MIEALKQALRQRGLSDEEIEAILQEAELTERIKATVGKLVGQLTQLLDGRSWRLEVYETTEAGRLDWVLLVGNGEEWRGSVRVGEREKAEGDGRSGRQLFKEDDLVRLANLLGKEVTDGARKYLSVYVVNWTKEALKAGLLAESDELVQRARQSRQW